MRVKHITGIGMGVAASALALGIAGAALVPSAWADGPPKYKYDPTWPKELPNKWTMEGVTGMFVDQDDHIWVLNRPRDLDNRENLATFNPPVAECCVAPPAIQTLCSRSTKIVCSDFGQPGTEFGTPQAFRRFPSTSNSITAGAQPGD